MMELQLQPQSDECCATGAAFTAGDPVASLLVRDGEGFRRYDCLVSAEAAFAPAGEILCRWTRIYKAPQPEVNAERALKLTAETLFLSLTEDGREPEENAALKQFLALMLERKRVLKNRGRSSAGHQLFEHMPSNRTVEVPVGEMDAEFFLKIRDKLGPLLGDTIAAPPTEKLPTRESEQRAE